MAIKKCYNIGPKNTSHKTFFKQIYSLFFVSWTISLPQEKQCTIMKQSSLQSEAVSYILKSFMRPASVSNPIMKFWCKFNQYVVS